jgi:hypothetical protein
LGRSTPSSRRETATHAVPVGTRTLSNHQASTILAGTLCRSIAVGASRVAPKAAYRLLRSWGMRLATRSDPLSSLAYQPRLRNRPCTPHLAYFGPSSLLKKSLLRHLPSG